MSNLQLPARVAGACSHVLVQSVVFTFFIVSAVGFAAEEGDGVREAALVAELSGEALLEAKVEAFRELEGVCRQLALDARLATTALQEVHGKVVTRLSAAPEDEDLKKLFDEIHALRTQLIEKQQVYRQRLEAVPDNEVLVEAQNVALGKLNVLRSSLREETARKLALESEIKDLRKTMGEGPEKDGAKAGDVVPAIEGADPS